MGGKAYVANVIEYKYFVKNIKYTKKRIIDNETI